MANYAKLYQDIFYEFKNHNLLLEALTHPSIDHDADIRKDKIPNYQRLEFLGDAVLNLLITQLLLDTYKDETEGMLSKRREVLVSGETLAVIAKNIGLGEYIIMTKGEDICGGRENKNTLENALESIIGAMYIDSQSLDITRKFIYHYWFPSIQAMKLPPKDPKSTLQEWAQKRGKSIPVYSTVSTVGPSHAPLFTIEVKVEGLQPYQATNSSKKIAARQAAEGLIKNIERLNDQQS